MTDYRIENSSSVFDNHASLFETDMKRRIEEFRSNYPDEKIPEHSMENFNLPKALSVMASEIEKLKIMVNK